MEMEMKMEMEIEMEMEMEKGAGMREMDKGNEIPGCTYHVI